MANILIIDDDGALLMTVRAALMTKGHTVKQAQNGVEGLDFANREQFDLVITDANMPGGVSGFQLVKTLRKSDQYLHVPIFFLTGRREKKDVIEALEAGADDYIVKPIDYDLLFSKIDHILKTGRATASAQAHATSSAKPVVLSSSNSESESQVIGGSSGETAGSAPVQFAATWHLKLQIDTLTEAGLSLASGFKVPLNFEMELESPMFKEIGMAVPKLKVVACHENPDSGAGFTIETRFVDIPKGDVRRISEWIRNAAKKQFA